MNKKITLALIVFLSLCSLISFAKSELVLIHDTKNDKILLGIVDLNNSGGSGGGGGCFECLEDGRIKINGIVTNSTAIIEQELPQTFFLFMFSQSLIPNTGLKINLETGCAELNLLDNPIISLCYNGSIMASDLYANNIHVENEFYMPTAKIGTEETHGTISYNPEKGVFDFNKGILFYDYLEEQNIGMNLNGLIFEFLGFGYFFSQDIFRMKGKALNNNNNLFVLNIETNGYNTGKLIDVQKDGSSMFYINGSMGEVVASNLSGSGNAYVCVDVNGRLYRSVLPCV